MVGVCGVGGMLVLACVAWMACLRAWRGWHACVGSVLAFVAGGAALI